MNIGIIEREINDSLIKYFWCRIFDHIFSGRNLQFE